MSMASCHGKQDTFPFTADLLMKTENYVSSAVRKTCTPDVHENVIYRQEDGASVKVSKI